MALDVARTIGAALTVKLKAIVLALLSAAASPSLADVVFGNLAAGDV